MYPIHLSLPYPPSVNHYWVWTGRGWTIGKKGRTFINDVKWLTAGKPKGITDRLIASAYVYPPDNRRRDLDNINKAIWDSLEKAGIYENDSQIDELHMYRMPVCKPGKVEIVLNEFISPPQNQGGNYD